MICRLSYPRNQLDLGFLVPEVSQYDTVALLSEVTLCQGYSTARTDDVPAFRSVTYIIEPTPLPYSSEIRQQIREDKLGLVEKREHNIRKVKSKNLLLTSMLGRIPDAEWILHLDTGIVSLTIDEPKGMTAINVPFIEKLLDYGRTGATGQVLEEGEKAADIVVANVLTSKPRTDDFLVYETRTWMSCFCANWTARQPC
jgi:hypothetical protein